MRSLFTILLLALFIMAVMCEEGSGEGSAEIEKILGSLAAENSGESSGEGAANTLQ